MEISTVRRRPLAAIGLAFGLVVAACWSSPAGLPSVAGASAAGASEVTSAGASASTGTGASASASTGTEASASAGGSAAASGSVGEVALPAPEKTSLKIGLSTGGEASQYAEYLAKQLDLYKKYGFDNVEVTTFEGDGKVVQALVAGGLDLGVVGVSSAISSQATDTPLKVVAMNGVTLTDMLVCQQSIKTPEDIKGKTVAVSTFGGTSHGSVLILLSQLGLTANDVTITQVGNQTARIAAVKAGSVGCAPIDLAQKDAMTKAGLNIIADNKSSGKQWGRSGLAGTSEFISKNPNTVLGVVAAALEAQNYMFTNTQDAGSKFAEYTQQAPEEGQKIIQDFTTWGDRSMSWGDDAFDFPKQTLAAVNPAMASVDITKAYDKSFLQKLSDMGFYQKIGDPELPK